ncbi:hypothetical protein M427DRAFT_285688 [Gonapodya prolifera JEL478]|uniref:RING-type E3 ubiquitin transferase n=1 Tax=Gonapodya prolifera (strain JEL478) TaxID=1344416 RepID=A0A139AJZ4_GONPJ|nr:hypothetical protein M427DRAFT_285688 [Gonapodya prolifera JEL478]|eukprot:KXS16823.1 hypothetical protein M427DRAFT_285688 [Gonapodya prolifera JEL478]
MDVKRDRFAFVFAEKTAAEAESTDIGQYEDPTPQPDSALPGWTASYAPLGNADVEGKPRDVVEAQHVHGDTGVQANEDADAHTCIICSSPWSNAGSHRIVSLKCGHLFGFCCIEKWLRVDKKKKGMKTCPLCAEPAAVTHIRPIIATRVVAKDDLELRRTREQLEHVQKQYNTLIRENAALKLTIQAEKNTTADLKRKNQALEGELSWLRNNGPAKRHKANHVEDAADLERDDTEKQNEQTADDNPAQHELVASPRFSFTESLTFPPEYTCPRVLSHDPITNVLFVSVEEPQRQRHGLMKVNLYDSLRTEFIPVHSKQIRDCNLHPLEGGMALTASVDKSLKLTHTHSNTVVATFNVDKPAWSCCWHGSDPNYIYAGLVSNCITVFDIRKPATSLMVVGGDATGGPGKAIHSLSFVASGDGRSAGLIGANLETVFMSNCVETLGSSHLRSRTISRLSDWLGNCTSMSFDSASDSLVATFRNPGTMTASHRLGKLCVANDATLKNFGEVGRSPVGTSITRSSLFTIKHSTGESTILATGDYSQSRLQIWDLSNKIQNDDLVSTHDEYYDLPLYPGATVLDAALCKTKSSPLLACLTQSSVHLFGVTL